MNCNVEVYMIGFVDDQPEEQGKFALGNLLKITNSKNNDPSTLVALEVN